MAQPQDLATAAHDATISNYRDYVTTSFVAAVEPVAVARAEGATVWDEDGTRYIDCFAGIAVVNAGHCHPKVIEAAKAQIDMQLEQMKQDREDQRKKADLDARMAMNLQDNQTAMQLAAAEIASGERFDVSTGTGINPQP